MTNVPTGAATAAARHETGLHRRFRQRDLTGDTPRGIASRGYLADGTQDRIVAALDAATDQAEFEALAFDVSDIVANIGSATA